MNQAEKELEQEALRKIASKMDQVFPDMQFKEKKGGEWRSPLGLFGESMPERKDRTVMTPGYLILIQNSAGNPSIGLKEYIIKRYSLPNSTHADYYKHIKPKILELAGMTSSNHNHTFKSQKISINKQPLNNILNEQNIWKAVESYCKKQLQSHEGGKEYKDYLKSRGYSNDKIQAVGVGYLPSRAELFEYLKDKSTSEEIELIRNALDRRKPNEWEKVGKPYSSDWMIGGTHHKLIIPFRASNIILGITARDLRTDDERKKNNKEQRRNDRKYFNSTGMKYGDELFNLFLPLKGKKEVVIVEGLLDALSSSYEGIENVVALGNNDLNESQLDKLKDAGATSIILFLDNDEAGLTATPKTIDLIRDKAPEIPLYVVNTGNLEGIKDADELIGKRGKEALQSTINDADDWAR